MLPNRFPDHGEQPDFNAVDASLWYVVTVHEYLGATARLACRSEPSFQPDGKTGVLLR